MPMVICERVPFACFVQFRTILCCVVLSFVFVVAQAFAGEVTPRPQPHAGSIVRVTGDAEIRFVEAAKWLTAENNQNLLAGDGLRTGSLGTMALLFADRTQIRVQRNSILTVKSIVGSGRGKNTVLRLDQGGTWSRAVAGGTGVRIETPSATASIRGTDWSLTVDRKGSTQLVVLDGEIVLENKFGRMTVKQGEVAFAEIGKAPIKTILVTPRDREQKIYNLSLVDALAVFFKLTDLKVSERRQKLEQIRLVAAPERSVLQWVELAELACDLGDTAEAYLALKSVKTGDAQLNARAEVVSGYLALASFNFTDAAKRFETAASGLTQNSSLSALIGRTASLLLLRRSDEAKALVEMMAKNYGDAPRFLLFKSILTTFSGDFPEAVDQVRQLAQRFPDNSSFPAVEGQLAIVLDRPDQARIAAERVLAIDPGFSVGYQVSGLFRQTYLGDSEGAIKVIRQGLSYNDTDSVLWTQLGYIYLMMGEYRKSEEVLLKSLNLNPYNITGLANYSLLLLDQYRLKEAGDILRKMEQLDSGRDFTMNFWGRLALQTDKIVQAQESFLKATTLSPAMSDSSLGLAQTYYEKGDFVEARQALDNAGRMDPNSPLIPLVGSVIASDLAYADQAIEYAREAIQLYRQRGGEGITGLASSRGGNNTLGSAFSNLGLKAWANYYNELSFDPYSADSHFYRALQDGEDFSSLYQGLLLEPLAVSARNRFVDFYRRPFADSEISASVGWPANGTSYGGSVNTQGFLSGPKPMSYYLKVNHSYSPEDRENGDKLWNGVVGAIGVNVTPYDRLVFDVNVSFSENGMPGVTYNPDYDDEDETRLMTAGLGYSHYFAARDIVFGRIMVLDFENTFSNEDPFGQDLSSLDYSLLYNYGIEATNLLYEKGMSDFTSPADPNSPELVVGGSGPFLENTIKPGLDTTPSSRYQTKVRSVLFNARHMFTLGSVDYTYGVELSPYRLTTETDFFAFQQRDPGTGQITGPGISFPFLYGDPVPQSQQIEQNGMKGNAYADALWRIDEKIWIEAGLFGDYNDNDLDSSMSQLDPRIGVAWQATSSDWLRLMLREDTGRSPLSSVYSLAPVTTVGMRAANEFVGDDGRSATYAARWDREWSARFFTALELRRQDIHDFATSVPDSEIFFNVGRGRIDQARLSANLWLNGGIGLYALGILSDSENRDNGPYQGNGLPLIPEQQLDAGIQWVHPRQIRVNLVVHFIDERSADVEGITMLGSSETVDFSATWQPLNRHLELGLSVTNVFDQTYEVGEGIPGKGRHVMATLTWRF